MELVILCALDSPQETVYHLQEEIGQLQQGQTMLFHIHHQSFLTT